MLLKYDIFGQMRRVVKWNFNLLASGFYEYGQTLLCRVFLELFPLGYGRRVEAAAGGTESKTAGV